MFLCVIFHHQRAGTVGVSPDGKPDGGTGKFGLQPRVRVFTFHVRLPARLRGMEGRLPGVFPDDVCHGDTGIVPQTRKRIPEFGFCLLFHPVYQPAIHAIDLPAVHDVGEVDAGDYLFPVLPGVDK